MAGNGADEDATCEISSWNEPSLGEARRGSNFYRIASQMADIEEESNCLLDIWKFQWATEFKLVEGSYQQEEGCK
jgi:hypothetical protein